MSFLPIVDRELRTASRRWSTYLARSVVGAVAILIAVPVLFFGWMIGGGSGAGQKAFSVLSGYIFVVALLGGILVTTDCLSSEKREGTLGLLFLTDLKGYDVVLGKFAALGLHSIYGLVAVFPVLALPLLSGGVTGGEFWRVSLALLNLLFVSLSMGMVVSAVAREAGRSFSATLLLLLLLVAGLPLGMGLLELLPVPEWTRQLIWLSPGHAFAIGRSATAGELLKEYWLSLGLSHGLGWLLLGGAAVLVPRHWQDQEERRDRPTLFSRVVGTRVARIFRAQRSPAMLERNPMLWLMGERRVLKIILWSLAGVWCAVVVLACVIMKPETASGMVVMWSFVFLFIYALHLVEHSCRFWVEARQNGNLEVLLSVPIGSQEILSSHWASIRRHFLWPLVTVLCATTLPTWLGVIGKLLKGDTGGGDVVGSLFMYASLGVFLAWFLATYVAIGYTGMWLALKLRKPQFASGLTLLLVVVLPMMFCFYGIGATLIFIFLPMSLLQSNLRGMIMQHYVPVVKHARTPRS